MFFFISLAISLIISRAFAPKAVKPPPPAIQRVEFDDIAEGNTQPIIFGDVWIKSPQILWYGDQREDAIEVKDPSSGGGLFGGLFG